MQARTISYLRCAAYFRLLPRTRILQNRQDTQTHSRRRSYARSDFAFHTLSVVMNTNKNLGACRAEGYEAEMFVEFFPDKSDYFSHGKCSQNGANSKSFDASETNACDQCGGCQTYDIKGYFYF